MNSGVRPRDALGYQPRSKTLLNGVPPQVLVASEGIPIVLAESEDGSTSAPTRVQLCPVGMTIRIWNWDIKTEKLIETKIHMDREYLEKMVANTIELRKGNPLPWFKDHFVLGPAFGWFRPEDLELTDTDFIANNVKWIGETPSEIAQEKWRYCSIGWLHEHRDYRTDKLAGPILREASLTNFPKFVGQLGLAASDSSLIIAAAIPVAAEQEEVMDLDRKSVV